MWTLRERRDEDLPRCVEILREAHLAEGYPFRWPVDPESWLSSDHLLQALVAEDDTGSIGGHVALVAATPNDALLERLFVAPTASRSGIGRRLLESSLHRADAADLRVCLEVADNCTAAIDLYRKLGWTETCRTAIDWGAGSPRALLTLAAPHSPLHVEPALDHDVEEHLEIRDLAARWQQAGGLDQWVPGELTPHALRRQIDKGGVQVVRDGERVAASIRLTSSDPEIWGDDAHSAGYIHGLMTRARGTGLGSRLLRWAEHRMIDNGRSLSRLDCVASNAKLREFYRGQGYTEVGSHTFADPRWSPVTTFEKALSGRPRRNTD